MERKILFRGQKINSKEWVYGSLIETNQFVKKMPKQHSKFWIVTNSFGNGGWFNVRSRYHVKTETVGRYWKNDRLDKKMFAGDTVKIHQFLFDGNEVEQKSTAIIRDLEDGFALEFTDGDFMKEYVGVDAVPIFMATDIFGLHEESFELIGSIHEGGET